MQNEYNNTKILMKKYGITANKKLGQNFLIDENVVKTIIEEAEVTKQDLVIEIGPGLGTLTQKLIEKAGKVIAIEIDKRMIKILEDRFVEAKNFEIINKDVLKINLEQLIKQNKKENIQKVKIVANLPYYITTPIIMKLLEEKLDIVSITVMIQKEVAQRLSAIPGNKKSGAITYAVYYYSEAKQILTVPSNSFIPEPEVQSEVIKLQIRNRPPIQIEDEKKFFKLIKLAFSQRRKTLVNALTTEEYTKQKIKQVLNELKINTKVRGEALTMEQFAEISKNL